jgi:2,4-dienoyl-CoA reductase-like NADH-dependent reductase (Old Yellow Enzyme family)
VTGSTCDGRQTGLPVATAWCIDDPKIANATIEQGQLDLVMVARAHLADPHYPYVAAQAVGKDRPSWVLPAPYAHWLERYRGIGKAAAQ